MAERETKAIVQCRMISPQFVVPDVVAAAEYYREVLGFGIPTTQVYKCYEFVIEDRFGYRLVFGMDISSRPAAPARS